MEDAPPVPTVLSTSSAPPAIDDGEEMIIDDENEKSYSDDRDFDMGEADDPPTRCGVNQPLLGVFGSSFKTDEPAPQQPSNTMKSGPQLDDVDMDEVTTDVTMRHGSSQPITFGTVLAPVRPNPINIVPAPLRADAFGNVTTPQPIPFSVVAAPDPVTIVPAPPRHDQFGTLSTQWTSMTSMSNSFSGGEPVGAPVSNDIGRDEPIQTPIICRFGGDQSTHVSTISDSGGHPTQAPTNNAFGGIQHLKGTTVTHGPSIQPFSTTSLSNPGTSSHILGGPNNPSNSGSLMPSQKAKIMTQMLNYDKGDSGSVSVTAVSRRSSINPGTDIFPSTTPTARHDSSSSNVFDIISPPAPVRPGSGSTAQKSSNIESKVTPIRGTSTGSMEVAHDLLSDAEKVEKAEKANRRNKAKREKDRLVPPTPRERLIPKVRALNTRLIQKDDFAKSRKADTGAKRDASPNRSKTFVVPGPSVPLEETDEDRQLRELTAKMDAQASQHRKEMNRQNTELEFGTEADNAEWHEGTGRKTGQALFTKEDFLKKRKEFKRLQSRAREEVKTDSAADALMDKMNAADPARKQRQEKDTKVVSTGSEKEAWKFARMAAVAKERSDIDEESEISDLDPTDLACILDQVNHNQALKDEAEKLMKRQKQAEGNETEPDDKIDDGWEPDMHSHKDTAL